MDLITNIMTAIPTFLDAALQIVGGFAVISMWTPNKSDDKIVDMILKVLNFMGANAGKARNAE